MGLDVMLWYRAARKLADRGVPFVPVLLRKLSYILHSSYVPYDAEIGEGTIFGYGGIGVVIHAESKIGHHCVISQQVTLGGRSGRRGAPVVGNYVRIGAGAKVLGAVTIGDYAVIGANAVVLKDVPEAGVVAGVPARLIRIDPTPELSYQRELGIDALPMLASEAPPLH